MECTPWAVSLGCGGTPVTFTAHTCAWRMRPSWLHAAVCGGGLQAAPRSRPWPFPRCVSALLGDHSRREGSCSSGFVLSWTECCVQNPQVPGAPARPAQLPARGCN